MVRALMFFILEKMNISLFDDNIVRRVWYKGEWWFVVADVVSTLINSLDTAEYIKNMRTDSEFNKWYIRCAQVLEINVGMENTLLVCSNIEGVFRVIQSIQSSEAEPFKLWMAKLGKMRLDELRTI